MVLEQKQTHRSTEQNTEPRNKTMHLWSQKPLKKEARIYNVEKTVSSISDAGKTGQFYVNKY